jgi:hypothetical protein
MGGWKGFGTVTEDQLAKRDGVWFVKDGEDPKFYGHNCACSHEVALVRPRHPR